MDPVGSSHKEGMVYRRFISCGLVILALASWSTAVVSAHGGDGANQAADLVRRVAPPVQGEVQTRAIKNPDGSYATMSANTTTGAPVNSRGHLVFASRTRSSKTSLTIGLPVEVAPGDAVLSSDGSIVYGSDSETSSIVVQLFTDGVRISTTLTSKEAGTSFSYPLDLQKGSRIDVQDNGGVLITGPDGSFSGGLLPPWAKDRNGVSVPTHYEVHGDSVVQVIDRTSADLAYPVVADPYFGIDLIDHYSWSVTYKAAGWTDHVFPTPWAIAMSGNYSVAEFGWEELVHKDPIHNAAHFFSVFPGLHDQYDCHQILGAGFFKSSYNLDIYRLNVGLAQTILDQCNPPIYG
jgi:hypothetical protein